MADLNSEQQTFIVQQFAMFRKATEILTELKNFYEVELTIQQIANYDPTKPYYKGSKKWKTLHEKTREEFLKNINKIPIANSAYRLKVLNDELDSLLNLPEQSRSKKVIMALTEQAAKESGGMFTNRRELTGKDGKDLMPEELASVVFKDLVREGWTAEDAAKWVAGHYKVDKEKVLNGT